MRMASLSFRGSVIALGWSLMLAGSGCTTNSQSRSESAVVGMQQMRQEIADGNTQVDKVLVAMNAMPPAGDNLRSAYDTFSKEVDNTKAQADSARNKAQDLKDRQAQYVSQWQAETGTITDPTLKATADARRQAVQQHFEEIETKIAAARDAYKTFYDDLTGLRTYLGTQLTVEAVGDAKPSFDKANRDGADLKDKISKVDLLMAQVMQTLPSVPAPAPAGN
jgi:chromosome segregation ATPase